MADAGVAAPEDRPVFVSPKECHLLVNTLVVNEVIPSVLQLCLEYGVHNKEVDQNIRNFVHRDDTDPEWSEKVDKAINDFVQNEGRERPNGWYEKNHMKYQKSYKELDTTNLMEIITKVTHIKHDNKNSSYLQLFQKLKELKDFRNIVVHEMEVAFSEAKIDHIYDKVNAVLDELANLFDLKSNELVFMKQEFEMAIEKIKDKDNQQANTDKLIHQIQQSLINEIPPRFWEIVQETMTTLTLPLSDTQISLSDIFHESDFEVKPVHSKGSTGYRNSFPCTDIFSEKDVFAIDIIEGDPGSGKSVFLKKVCIEFCENKNISIFKSFSRFQLMFHFNCRERFNASNFYQYFTDTYRATAENFPEVWVIRALRALKIIIAIDGLDECNEESEALVHDIIRNFSDSKTVKFLITTRPGFSKRVVEQFKSKATKYRVLNIKPMQDITEKQQFIKRVIKQMPEVNENDILNTFKNKQRELHSHFVRPIGLMLFVILFRYFPHKIENLSHELGLMQLTFDAILQNMTERMPKVVNSSIRAYLIMEMSCRYSLQWFQNKTYEIKQENFQALEREIFLDLGFAKDGKVEVSVAAVISCVFLQQKCTTGTSAIYDYFHRSQQEYLASKALTEKLMKTHSGTLLEILSGLTREDVNREDLKR